MKKLLPTLLILVFSCVALAQEADAGFDQVICGNTTTLEGNIPTSGTGIWTHSGSADIISPTMYNTVVENISPGINTFTWTIGGSSDQVVITNNSVAATAGSDIEICNSDVYLSSTPPVTGTGSWSLISGAPVTIVDQTDPFTQVTGLTGGVYIFTWTVVNGACSDSDDIVVTNSSPSIAVASTPSPEVCDGNGQLMANAAGIGETGLWTGGFGSIITAPDNNNTTVSNMPLGINTYTWTLSKGTNVTCTSANSVTITNNEVVADAGTDKTTSCHNYVTLEGSNPAILQGTGIWTDESGTTASFTDAALYNTLVTNIQLGTTIFRWTVSQGTCSEFDDVIITNNQITAHSGSNQSSCSSSYGPLDANDPSVGVVTGVGAWSSADPSISFDVVSMYNTTVNNLQSGQNTLKWTVTSSAESCTSESTVSIYNNGVSANAGSDIETCLSSINLSAIAPTDPDVSGTWTQLSGPPVTIVDLEDANTSITGMSGGVYIFNWTLTNSREGNCSDSDEVMIINSQPEASLPIASSSETCDGTVSLNANPLNSGETGLWTAIGATITSPTLPNTTVTDMPLGTTEYKWTISKGTLVTCTNEGTVSVVNNTISSNAGTDKTSNCHDYASLEGNNPALTQGNGMWTTTSGANIVVPNQYNSQVTDLNQGTNEFTWIVSLGTCPDVSSTVVITNNQITAHAGTEQSTCNSSYGPLDANDPTVGVVKGTGEWSCIDPSISFTNNSVYNTTVNNLKSGLNTLRWTVTSSSENCTHDSEVIINNNDVTANAGPDIETCNTEVNLAGITPNIGTGTWSQTSGALAIITDPTDPNTSVTGLAGGVYTFTWTVENGACSDSDVMIVTNSSPSIAVASTPSPEVCDGNGQLMANAAWVGETGLWTGGFGSVITSPGDNNTTVSNMPLGVNTYTWTLSKGTNVTCTSESSVTITNNEVVAYATAEATSLCNNYVYLTGSDPSLTQGTGIWTVVGGAANFMDEAEYNTLAEDIMLGSNVFRWTVSHGSCSVYEDVTVTNNQIVAEAGADENTCNNYLDPLNAFDVSSAGGTGEWSSTGTATFTEKTLYNTRVENLQTGVNTLTWTIASAIGGCTDSDNVIITNNSVTANAGLDIETCNSDINLSAIPPGTGTGSWSQTSGALATIIEPTDPNTSVTGLAGGVYTFKWTVENGACSDSDVMIVTNSSPSISVASTTSPEVCDGNGVLQANAAGVGETGLWTGGAGSIINSPGDNNTTVSNMPLGVSTYNWTLSKGTDVTCTSTNSVTITNNEVVADAGTDIPTCSNSINLAANDPALTQGTGVWTILTGMAIIEDEAFNNTLVENLALDMNTFRWTVSKGLCSASDDVTITNNHVQADAGLEINTCDASVNLNGNEPAYGTGFWSKMVGSTASINTPSLYNTSVNVPVKNTPYSEIFTWAIENNGCISSDDVIVNNNAFINYANADDYTCDGSYTMFGRDPGTVSPTAAGYWSILDGNGVFDSSTLYDATVSNLNIDINTLKWTIINKGCSGSSNVVITNNAVTSTSSTVMTCDASTTITANNPAIQGATGVWNVENKTTQFIESPNSYTTNVSGLVPNAVNRFTWTVTKGNCSASSTSEVEYYVPNAKIIIADVAHGCDNQITLIADPSIGTGAGEWYTPSTSVTYDNNTATTTVAYNLPQGNTTFTWTVNDGGCTSSDQVTINNSLPVNDGGADVAGCSSELVIGAEVPTATGNGLWTLVSGNVSFNDDTNPFTIMTAQQGTNIVEWTIMDNGCSSTKRFNVVNNLTSPNAGADLSVCANEVQLSGSTLASGESGLWTVEGGSGTETFTNASINNPYVSNLSPGLNAFVWTVSNGNCTVEDRVVITNNTPLVSAGDDQTICGDYLKLSGNYPGAGSVGIWSVGSAAVNIETPSFYATDVSNLSPGTNSFRWTINNGLCEAYDEVLITSNVLTVDAGVDTQDCTDTLSLVATAPPSGFWGYWESVVGNAMFDNPASNITIARNLGAHNRLRWTITDGTCSYFDEIEYENQLPTTPIGLDTKAVCSGTVTITSSEPDAVNGESGLWTKVSGPVSVSISSPSSFQTEITGLGAGSNAFRWTISNANCSASHDIIVVNNEVFAYAGIDKTSSCQDYVILEGNNPSLTQGTGAWSAIGSAATFVQISQYNTLVENLEMGMNTFRWTVSKGLCSASDDVTITNNQIHADAGIDATTCNNYIGILDANDVSLFGGIGEWSSPDPSINFVRNSTFNTRVENLPIGASTLTWTTTSAIEGCIDSDNVTVTNNSVTSNAGPDFETCNSDINLSAVQPAIGIGVWTQTSDAHTSITSSINPNTSVTGLTDGVYVFRWTVENEACSSYDEVVVTNGSLGVPIVVTPTPKVCDGNGQLMANALEAGETGMWTKLDPTASGTITDATNNEATVSNLGFGETRFRWTVSTGNCTAFNDLEIINNSVNVTADPAGATEICVNEAPVLGNAPPANGIGSWSSTESGVTFDNNSQAFTTARNLPNGNVKIIWTIDVDGCLSSDEFDLTNNTISTSAGENFLVCLTETTLNAQSLVGGQTGLWTADNTSVVINDAADPSTQVSNLRFGDNIFTWTLTDPVTGCTASDQVIVSNNSFAVLAGVDKVSCGSSTSLCGSDPIDGTGIWTVVSGTGQFTNATNYETTVTDMENGQNAFKWSVNKDGCEGDAVVTITNDLYPAVAGDDFSICESSTIVNAQPLNSSWGATGEWISITGGGTFTNASSYSTEVTGLNSGENRFRWIVTKESCVSFDEVIVSNNSVTANAGSDFETCSAEITLGAVQPPLTGTGLWTQIIGAPVTIVNPTEPVTQVTNLSNGVYTFRWTVIDDLCSDNDEVVITNNQIHASAGTDAATCNNLLDALGANDVSLQGGTGAWTTTGTATFVNRTLYNTSVENLQQGVNVFTWTATSAIGGCMDSDDVTVNNNSVTAQAGPDIETCNSTINLNGVSPGSGTGYWTQSSGVPAMIVEPTEPATEVTDLTGGIYTFTWTIESEGCSSSDEVIVTNNQPNDAIITGPSVTEVCDNQVTLSAVAPLQGDGNWIQTSGNGIFTVAASNSVLTVTDLSSGINDFIWTVTNGLCSTDASISIANNSTVDFDTNISDSEVTFTVIGEYNSSTFYWDFGDASFSTEQNPVHIYSKPGVYDVTLSLGNGSGCILDVTRTIQIGEVHCEAKFEIVTSDLTVEFTDASLGDITEYNWDFGDQNKSFEQNPTHTYSSAGQYDVCLSIKNTTEECIDQSCTSIIVGDIQCLADFNYLVNASTLQVEFNNQSKGNNLKYFWNFGDANTSSIENPEHQFSKAGLYKVSLSIEDEISGCINYTEKLIQVGEVDCEANFDFFPNDETNTVIFNNISKGEIDKYYWDFGDGIVSTEESPTHLFSRPGRHYVSLTISNEENQCSDIVVKDFNLSANSCDAKFIYHVDAESKTISLQSSKQLSHSEYLWDFGDGNTSILENPTHIYETSRFYDVSLTVYNTTSGCIDKYELNILIGTENEEPKADFIYIPEPGNLKVIFADRSIGAIYEYLWDFGDGAISTEQNPEHPYSKEGTYSVCLTVKTSNGISSIINKEIQLVSEPVCQAKFSYIANQTTFNTLFFDESTGQPETWQWNLGDNNTSNSKDVEHTYDDEGYYTVHLNVSNGQSSSDYFDIINYSNSPKTTKAGFGAVKLNNRNKSGGIPYKFYGLSSGTKSRVEWDFGDQSAPDNSTALNPLHIYETAGEYEVCLTVFDDVLGNSDVCCKTISVLPTSINENIIDVHEVKVYPNPASDKFSVNYTLTGSTEVEIIIYDLNGKIIIDIDKKKHSPGSYKADFNIENLRAGTYLVKLKTDLNEEIIKFQVVR